MSEEILVNITPMETRVAVVDNGAAQDFHVERAVNRGIVGNIYCGKVVRVLTTCWTCCSPSMNCSLVIENFMVNWWVGPLLRLKNWVIRGADRLKSIVCTSELLGGIVRIWPRVSNQKIGAAGRPSRAVNNL